MEAVSTPRISAAMIDAFVGQNVMVVGKVVQLRGDSAAIDAGGQITAILNRESHLMAGNGAQIIGKVNPDLTIKVYNALDLGNNVDYQLCQSVVEVTHQYKDLFAGSQQRPFQSQPPSQPQTQPLSPSCNRSSQQARPISRRESTSTIASSSSESYGSIKSLEGLLSQMVIQDTIPSSQLTIQTQSADLSQPLGSQNTNPQLAKFTPSSSASALSSPGSPPRSSTVQSTGDVIYPTLPSPSTFFGAPLFHSSQHRDHDHPASLGTDDVRAQSASSVDSRLRIALEAFLERKREEELLEMVADSTDMDDDSESEDDEDRRWGRGL
ncbi:replication factor A protein 3-domain-containing protein [Camillea tinctor]|nr:replication factor A protein 3-domain-containing protein [Camillea tinctor]